MRFEGFWGLDSQRTEIAAQEGMTHADVPEDSCVALSALGTPHGSLHLGLRPRLVYIALSALYGIVGLGRIWGGVWNAELDWISTVWGWDSTVTLGMGPIGNFSARPRRPPRSPTQCTR